jgi:hypothetical protein
VTVPPVGGCRLLVVTYDAPERWAWLRADAAESRILAVGEGSAVGGDDAVRAVAADTAAVGLAADDAVRDAAAEGAPLVVCFDSLTALADHAGREAVFRFVHLLTGRLRSVAVPASATFYLDPNAHDAEEVGTLATLFDRQLGATDDP